MSSSSSPVSTRGSQQRPPEAIRVFSPNGPWATIKGQCVFIVSGITTFDGAEVHLGTMSNPDPVPKVVPQMVEEYEAQGFKWFITHETRELEQPEVEKIFRDASVPWHEWAVHPFPAQIRGPRTEIPACNDLTMNFKPRIREVTLRPVFFLSSFKMDSSGRHNLWVRDTVVQTFDSWRGWGEAWGSIFSRDYAMFGLAEVLVEGRPESVEGEVNYYCHRQPEW
jgi:hypothetical protein